MQLCPLAPTEPQAKMQDAAYQEPEAAPEAARGAAQLCPSPAVMETLLLGPQ